MRNFVDLHTHSSASDGDFAPAEIVRLAESKRLAAVALTDHDTTAGLAEAASAAAGLAVRFVPGVEISAKSRRGLLHVIGLGIDPSRRKFRAVLRRTRQARRQRNPKMIARLRALGVDITLAELRDFAGDSESVGRLHMAQLLCCKGCAASTDQAFKRYLGVAAPAYVDKERLEPAEAIEAIHAAGGLAVLAHPLHLDYANSAQLERLVRCFRHAGLDAIEVYHNDHTAAQTRLYLDLARRLGMMVSGGSDFHGRGKPSVRVGLPRTPLAAVEQVLAELGR